MNPHWTISGQTGATLDGIARPIGDVGLIGAVLTQQSFEVDTLTWTQKRGIIADDLQEVQLFCDGAREFIGTITDREFNYQSGGGSYWSFTASGALYKMATAQIADAATDEVGTVQTRPAVEFPIGDLRESVIRLLTAAPGIEPGEIAEMFTVGRRVFTGGSWLAMLVDLLKPVADVASWVDYSDGEIPRLHIERRGAMEILPVRIGLDDVSSVRLKARRDLKITGVSLVAAQRATTGALLFSSQVAGDGSQIVAISGYEMGIPYDPGPAPTIPSTTIQTTLINGSWAEALIYDSVIASALAANPGFAPGSYYSTLYDTYFYYPPYTYYTTITPNFPDSRTPSPTGKYRYLGGTSWNAILAAYGGVQSTVTVTGTFRGSYQGGRPGFLTAMQSAGRLTEYSGYTLYHSPGVLVKDYKFTTSYSVPAVNLNYPTLTTLYEPSEEITYAGSPPPPGMAEGMLAAANFVPYVGDIGLNPGFPRGRFLARRANVLGAAAELAEAGAIIQSAATTLLTGAVQLRCGAPARVSLNSVLSRYSASSKDNLLTL